MSTPPQLQFVIALRLARIVEPGPALEASDEHATAIAVRDRSAPCSPGRIHSFPLDHPHYKVGRGRSTANFV